MANVRYWAIQLEDGGSTVTSELAMLDPDFPKRKADTVPHSRADIIDFIKVALSTSAVSGTDAPDAHLCTGMAIAHDDGDRVFKWMQAKLTQALLVCEGFPAVAAVCPGDGYIKVLCADKKRLRTRKLCATLTNTLCTNRRCSTGSQMARP